VCSGRDRRERAYSVKGGLVRGAVGHVSYPFARGFDVGVEFQRVLDEAAIPLVLAPERDNVAALADLGTCEAAVGERLFELLPRLDAVGRLPLLDLLGDRGQFTLQFLARVLLYEHSRVVWLIARVLAGLDAAQLPLLDERLEFLVGRALDGVGLLADPVDRPGFRKRLGDGSNTFAGAHRLTPRLNTIRRDSDMLDTPHKDVGIFLSYVCTFSYNRGYAMSITGHTRN